jgi:TetR/AcrR family transcriptional regulator, ethionamide resistance regulator
MMTGVSSPSQRMRQRVQRENMRREILAAAERLLRERPYRELSVEAVMAQTGLTRTAFYRHFDDVPGLVLRLLEDIGRELYVIAAHWRQIAVSDFAAGAREGLAGIVDFFVEHGRLVRAVAEASVTDATIEQGYRGFMAMFTEIIKAGFDELESAGLLRVADTRALASAMNRMNEAYLLEEFGREPIGDRNVALATLETVWLRVITPAPPPEPQVSPAS